MTNKKTGLLNLQGMACGYIETAHDHEHLNSVELYLDGTWHVKSFEGITRVSWDCFDVENYHEALNKYYELCAEFDCGIYNHGPLEDAWSNYVHGSGFNYNIDMVVYEKQSTVHVNTFYQCMNENGFYVGSIPVKAIFSYNHGTGKYSLKNVIYRKEFHGCYIGDYIMDTLYENMSIV